jgi:hypothetical protein
LWFLKFLIFEFIAERKGKNIQKKCWSN